MASQMNDALFNATRIDITSKNKKHTFKANGSVLIFDGFLRAYNYNESDDTMLPDVKSGDVMPLKECTPTQHFTQPPARFTEATLVKQLEELGIGRPSTYASILSVIQDRGYVKMNDKKRLEPETLGRVVNVFLVRFFPKYVAYEFTANLENELDEISDGKLKKLKVLNDFLG